MNLNLNFVPVEFEGNTVIDVGFRPYDSEVLKNLRRRFGNTHVFKREHQGDLILDIPVVQGAKLLSNKTMEIDLKREYRHWPALLNAALVRAFYGKREIISDYPVQVLGSEKKNFIHGEKLPSWVQKRSLIEFNPRTIFSKDEKPIFGLLIDARIKRLLLASCSELLGLGISPIGKYVLITKEANDNRLAPWTQLVGRVERVENDKLILSDCRDGYETVEAKDVRLSGNIVDFDWCVRELLGSSSERVLSKSKEECSKLNVGPGRLKIIQETLAFIQKEGLEAVPGVKFKFGGLLSQKDTEFPITELIKKPSLVFDPSGSRTDIWNERGIKSNGPYDQRTFTPKKLNIAVICQGRYEGQVETFVAKFLEGMPDALTGMPGKQQARYGDGFLRRFQLERANVQNFTSTSPTLEGYEKACKEALSWAVDNNISWDLSLVQVEESFKSLPGSINPYFGTKSLLLKNHVAVQNIRLETMRQPDQNLVFTMNQMSLACYAKLGGRPWLLSAEQNVGHELVIGIGSHMASDSRIGGGKRQVGITTVFSSDGSYHLSERTNVVPFEEYSSALTETLKKTITRVREEDNWKNTDRVRLIFHMFKPAKDIEADAIKHAVGDLRLNNVSYAFLHIAPQNPFLIFDYDQKGEPAWARDKKGVLGPTRGLHLKISESQSLLVFSGASELKQPSDGMPKPCLLKLHNDSTFRDMTYLARQAFDFTAHSWRIMSPEAFPVTIKYSDLISERLTGLKQVSSWDDDAVKFRDIGRTPWFL